MPKIIQGPKKKDQPSKPVAHREDQKHIHKVDVATKPPTLTQKPVGPSLPREQGQH